MKIIDLKMHQLDKKCPEMVKARAEGKTFRVVSEIRAPYKKFIFERNGEQHCVSVGHASLDLCIKED